MTAPGPPTLEDVDPFDLPEWLGEAEVTWEPEIGLRTGHHVRGTLTDGEHEAVSCDLLAVDEAYPSPVADDRARLHAHQAWRHGQILLVSYDARLTLAIPGTSFSADVVLDALSRLAKAVGAESERYAARLRIGAETQRRAPRVP